MTIEAPWIPSAVNRFADALSRTWAPRDARAIELLVESVRQEYGLGPVGFRDRSLGEKTIVRTNYLTTQTEEN